MSLPCASVQCSEASLPSKLAATSLFCPHNTKTGRFRVLRTNQGGDVGSSCLHTGQHDAICTQGVGDSNADGIAQAHTQTRGTMVAVYSPLPGAMFNMLSREKIRSIFMWVMVHEEAAVNIWLRAKRLSAVHALMARDCQFPNSLQINYTNKESGERSGVLKNWE